MMRSRRSSEKMVRVRDEDSRFRDSREVGLIAATGERAVESLNQVLIDRMDGRSGQR